MKGEEPMHKFKELDFSATAKLEYLERQKRLQKNREKKKQEALNIRRQIYIGKVIVELFPKTSEFQPRRTEAENTVEFEELINFVTLLAADKEYISKLIEKAKQKMLIENQREV